MGTENEKRFVKITNEKNKFTFGENLDFSLYDLGSVLGNYNNYQFKCHVRYWCKNIFNSLCKNNFSDENILYLVEMRKSEIGVPVTCEFLEGAKANALGLKVSCYFYTLNIQ